MPNLTANISTPIQIKADITIGKEKIYPPLQSKEVVPSGETQVVVPDSEYYGLDKVTVEAISLQDKSVVPTTSEQVVKADVKYSGLNEVTVEPVTSEVDSNIQPSNIKEGVTILGVTGTLESPDFVFNKSSFRYMDQESVNIMLRHTVELVQGEAFYNSTLTELNLISDLKVLFTLSSCFEGCKNLQSINGNGYHINVSGGISNMNKVFYNCSSLTDIDLSIITGSYSRYCDFNYMLYGCTKLQSIINLNISSNNISNMFYNCYYLNKILFDGSAIAPSYNGTLTIDLSPCVSLTDKSISNMLDSLGANESGRNRTFKLSSETTALLTDETKQKATSKNYILA